MVGNDRWEIRFSPTPSCVLAFSSTARRSFGDLFRRVKARESVERQSFERVRDGGTFPVWPCARRQIERGSSADLERRRFEESSGPARLINPRIELRLIHGRMRQALRRLLQQGCSSRPLCPGEILPKGREHLEALDPPRRIILESAVSMQPLGPLKGENSPRESNYVISWLRFAEEASVILEDGGRAARRAEARGGGARGA
ncbi:hypothetical protein KM043_001852 [Ampulex compressa]|nr:hypothetical protein KM043_001852 [Ampulex compressa]